MSEVVDRSLRIRDFDLPLAQKIARLAEEQHGVVATLQLKVLGHTRQTIYFSAKVGQLHRIYRGVYAVGYRRLTQEARWMAAVLACGPDAVLSHRAAAAFWGLRRGAANGPVDVTVPGRTRKGQAGIRVHNVRRLHHPDVAVREGIPVTSLHRTLLDYAAVASKHDLTLAFEAAERQQLLDLRVLNELLDRNRRRRGVTPLRKLIAQQIAPPDTRSDLERRFLELVRTAGLPEPQVNVVVEGHLVDFFWPRQRLIVEVDSYAYHRSRRSFEDDRDRDVKLQLRGNRVLRITDLRIADRPAAVQRDLLTLLSAAA